MGRVVGVWVHLHGEAGRLNRPHLETSIILITKVTRAGATLRARTPPPPTASDRTSSEKAD